MISRAEALGDVDGIDAVAEGLREGAALFVEGPAGGRDHPVGSVAAQRDGGEQGGVEPAAVLVAALGVEVGGEVELGFVSRTACQLAPDSNQTSRMSISLRNSACRQLQQAVQAVPEERSAVAGCTRRRRLLCGRGRRCWC